MVATGTPLLGSSFPGAWLASDQAGCNAGQSGELRGSPQWARVLFSKRVISQTEEGGQVDTTLTMRCARRPGRVEASDVSDPAL
jgi:hypothetical protein